MPRFFTEKIEDFELEEKISQEWEGKSFSIEDWDEADGIDYKSSLGEAVEKDLQKVKFGTQKFVTQKTFFETSGEPFVGFHTLENELSYLGIKACAQSEKPLFFIVYWDGEKLRGYIPKKGNTWNTKTHQAFGLNKKGDQEYLKQKGYSSIDEVKPNFGLMLEEIKERIVYKNKKN